MIDRLRQPDNLQRIPCTKGNARLLEIHGFAYLSRGRFAFIEGGAVEMTDLVEKMPVKGTWGQWH